MENMSNRGGLRISNPRNAGESALQQRVLDRARLLFVPQDQGGSGYEFTEIAPGQFYVRSELQALAGHLGYIIDLDTQQCECPFFEHHNWCKHQIALYIEVAEKASPNEPNGHA